MLALKIGGLILTNTLLGVLIAHIFGVTITRMEFSKLLNFIADQMEDVFKIDDKHGIEQFLPLVLFLNMVSPILAVYLVFYFLRLIYLLFVKFPFVLGKETYYLRTKKKG